MEIHNMMPGSCISINHIDAHILQLNKHIFRYDYEYTGALSLSLRGS